MTERTQSAASLPDNSSPYRPTRHVPQQARAKERVRQILVATSSLAVEVGVDKITTNLIAERASLPVGSIYKYFHDKRAIIASLYDLYTRDITNRIEMIESDPLVPELTPEYFVDTFYGEWINFTRDNRLDILRSFLRSEPVWPEVQQSDQKIVSAVESLLQKVTGDPNLQPVKALLLYRLAMAYEATFNLEEAEANEYYRNLRLAALVIVHQTAEPAARSTGKTAR